MRRLLWTLLILAAIAAPGYGWLVLDGAMPDDADFALDIAALRQTAATLPGDRPQDIRYEHVLDFTFARAMVVAGDPWEGVPIPVYAYQLAFPDRTLMIDTAMDRAIAKPDFLVPMYDDAAYARMLAAMEKASLIVITHEHMDHIGGIAAHPRLSALLPSLLLTQEQLDHPERMDPAKLPDGVLDGYRPLRYEGLHALAPGVVLIKASGHTPGSQMVYVHLADGREVLLLGDVVWQMRNIDTQRERPRFMTLLIGEDRRSVFGQIKALGRLRQQAPELAIVPGHDGAVVDRLTRAGVLVAGFR